MNAFARLHPGVQRAVWQMGWTQLNALQSEAIPLVLESENHLILSAATASGKTEAAFLPIISALAADSAATSLQALYIGPLKALINDQFARLDTLCAHCDIPVHRWHGDVDAGAKARVRASPRGILLITPESLEALFLRRGREVPRLFAGVRFVVIDELHAFLESVRGVHLQSLLARMRAQAGCRPRLVGLSATLGDYDAARHFLNHDAPEKVALVDGGRGSREIRLGLRGLVAVHDDNNREGRLRSRTRLSPEACLALAQRLTPADCAKPLPLAALADPLSPATAADDPALPPTELADIADDVCRHLRGGTNLVFGNSKRTIETVADACHQIAAREHWPVDPFIVHHGSLAREERTDVEEMLKSDRPATAFCSSTLEMGIDIGSVRAVGQIDPPWTVASLLQRLGRSGRRAGEVSVMRLYTRDKSPWLESTLTDLLFPSLLRAVAQVRLVIARWLEPPNSERMHLSTLVHQLLSHLGQAGTIDAAQLHRALCIEGPFRAVTRKQFITLLRGLKERELIEQTPEGPIILGLAGERVTETHTFFAAFATTEELAVFNHERHLGQLAADLVPPVGENLILGGRRWQVQAVHASEKIVMVVASTNPRAPYFKGAPGERHARVAEEMRQVLLADELPAWLDASAKTLLNAARRVAHTAGLAHHGLIVGETSVRWYPWVSSATLRTLQLFARRAKLRAEIDELSISYHGLSPDEFTAHLQELVDFTGSATELSVLMAAKQSEKFDEFLPPALLDEANARDRLDLAAAQAVARDHLNRSR